MSRVRELTKPTALLLALALCLSSGCIFSPESGEIPPPPPIVIDSPAKLIDALTRAYQLRDDKLFASLLANDPDNNAEYLFLLSEPSSSGETSWGYLEEVRIHQRMFHPESPPPGDVPVPDAVWLQSLSINLTSNEIFSERPDLYSTNGGADGKLDPALWRAMDASYGTDLFFDLAGDTDYTVNGTANFVVIENLTKDVGDAGKFLLFIWEDVATPTKPAATKGSPA